MKIEKTVDRNSKEKLYVQIYAIFLDKIESGEWPAGGQIPPEDMMRKEVAEAILKFDHPFVE